MSVVAKDDGKDWKAKRQTGCQLRWLWAWLSKPLGTHTVWLSFGLLLIFCNISIRSCQAILAFFVTKQRPDLFFVFVSPGQSTWQTCAATGVRNKVSVHKSKRDLYQPAYPAWTGSSNQDLRYVVSWLITCYIGASHVLNRRHPWSILRPTPTFWIWWFPSRSKLSLSRWLRRPR